MRFTWDPAKAEINAANHDVSFEEAQEVFSDRNMLETFDELHSENERRYFAIGLSTRRLLTVVFAEPDDQTVRIISAWKSTQKEKQIYEEN